MACLASADSQFCSPNDTNCFPGVLSNAGTVYQHTFANAWQLFLLLHRALFSRHDRRGQCFGWLRTVGLVSRSGHCQLRVSDWLAFISRPTGSFTPWAVAPSDTRQRVLLTRLNTIRSPTAWTTKAATYPDNQVNNMACGVLTDAGTPYIYCVGGSRRYQTTATDRVFRYDPVTDTISPVAAPWPAAWDTVLPGGFTVFNNKLYILGGFDTITSGGQGTNQIWEFTPMPGGPWVQKPTVLPVPLGYIPTTTIGSLIYTGGGSDITAGRSYRYDQLLCL